jgi:hypothetical protein
VPGAWLLPVWPLAEEETEGEEADVPPLPDVLLPVVPVPGDGVVDCDPRVDCELELDEAEVDWVPELEDDDEGVDCVWVDVDCACSARVAAKSAAAPDDTILSELFMCT